jgi:transcriptional regulator with XRE-family HTH domain
LYDPIRGKLRRQMLGISAKDFAEAIGVSSQAVYMYESGQRTPSLVTFMAIAHELKIPMDSLIRQANGDKHYIRAMKLIDVQRQYAGGSAHV